MSKDLLTLLEIFLNQTVSRENISKRAIIESFILAYQSFEGMQKNMEESAHKLTQLKEKVVNDVKAHKNEGGPFNEKSVTELLELLENKSFSMFMEGQPFVKGLSGYTSHQDDGFFVLNQKNEIVFYNQRILSIFPYLERQHYPLTDYSLKGVSFVSLLQENVKQHLYDTMWQKTAASHQDQVLQNLQQETCEWEEKLASQHMLHYRSYQGYDGCKVILIQEKTTAQIGTHHLAYMAYYDQLTNTMNRQFFLDRLDYMIQDQKTRMPLALLALDLDGFKEVNDVYGHEMGDWLLTQVAQRLKKNTRQGDLVARFGGDEFVILFKNIAHQDSIRALGERLLDALCEPYARGDILLNISSSMGIATYPTDCSSSDDLLKYADSAMYSIKQNGKKGIRFYSEIIVPNNNVMH